MEVSAKIKELEEEFKVLKAEVRNVLLDIREVILERSNPLGESQESAHLTLDLNTTARAMATEAAAHEAAKLTEEHASPVVTEDLDVEPENHHGDDPGLGSPATAAEEAEPAPEADAPKVYRRAQPPADDTAAQEHAAAQAPASSLANTEIPPMYMAGLPPLSGNGSLSAWVARSITIVGPHELERIIAIHRLWGNLPPNISRALAHLQELLQDTDTTEPPWLKVMQDLDRLASL
jgi:hypothetical protein